MITIASEDPFDPEEEGSHEQFWVFSQVSQWNNNWAYSDADYQKIVRTLVIHARSVGLKKKYAARLVHYAQMFIWRYCLREKYAHYYFPELIDIAFDAAAYILDMRPPESNAAETLDAAQLIQPPPHTPPPNISQQMSQIVPPSQPPGIQNVQNIQGIQNAMPNAPNIQSIPNASAMQNITIPHQHLAQPPTMQQMPIPPQFQGISHTQFQQMILQQQQAAQPQQHHHKRDSNSSQDFGKLYRITKSLDFNARIRHPSEFLYLVMTTQFTEKHFQLSECIISDSFLCPACLLHPPEIIAEGAAVMAAGMTNQPYAVAPRSRKSIAFIQDMKNFYQISVVNNLKTSLVAPPKAIPPKSNSQKQLKKHNSASNMP